MEVKDKRVVVTGAASGIGKALCEAFNDAEAKSIVEKKGENNLILLSKLTCNVINAF